MTTTTAPPTARTDEAKTLIDAVQQLSMARSMTEIQAVVRTYARRLTGADGATFVLREDPYCFYADEDAISPLWKGQRFPLESCISGWTMRHREPAVIEDIYRDERIPHEVYRPTFVKSLVMVPIRTQDPVGAIGNYWARQCQPSERQVMLLGALADSAAVAMEHVRMLEELEQRVAARTAELRARAEHHLTVLNELAHEVRTPLAAADGMLELALSGEESLPDQARGDLEISRQSIQEALRIVDDQLRRARSETGDMPVACSEVELGAEVSSVREALRALASSERVELKLELPAEPVWAYTDPILLRHVLRNLFANALKFTDEGEVRLGARSLPDGGTEVWVADTGIGIAPAHLERVFEPWQQVDADQPGRAQGSGLGLPLVRQLVERLGGTLSVESRPGAGSRFTVRLPSAPPAP